MSYQVLARKWRPRYFKDLVGQEAVIRALVNGLDNDRVHHAFLLTGTRGVGKTTLARILAKCLNCESGVTSTPCGTCGSCVDIDDGRFVDMMEIDAASRTKVDDTRELLDSVQFTPTRGRFKVYIIDEVHMLSTSSFNALLKTLEEPPPHVKFVLATTDAEKIPVTILSRCLRFNLRRLLPGQISEYLEKILHSESVEAEAGAIARISRAADGSMRDALSLMDQAISYGGGSLRDEEVADMLGSVDHAHIASIIGAITAGDAQTVLEIVAELSAQARNLESVLRELAEVLHRISLLQLAPDYRDEDRSDWDSISRLADMMPAEETQLYFEIATRGAQGIGLAPDPRTGLEMTLLRMMAFRPAESPRSAEGSGGSAVTAVAGKASGTVVSAGKAAGSASAAKSMAEAKPAEPVHAMDSMKDDRDWNGMLSKLKLSGPVKELARNIELESTDGRQWKFLIPDAVRHLGSDSMVQKLEYALSSQLGENIQLELHAAIQPVATPAVLGEQAVRDRLTEAELAIRQDPTVRDLEERFGAEIIEDSIQPLQ